MRFTCNEDVADSTSVLASIKTSVVMNLSEGSVFSGKIKVLTGVVSNTKLQPKASKPYLMNSELSRFWAG